MKNVPILLLMLFAVVSCGPQQAQSSNRASTLSYVGETPGCTIYSGFEHGVRFFVADAKATHDVCSISTAQ